MTLPFLAHIRVWARLSRLGWRAWLTIVLGFAVIATMVAVADGARRAADRHRRTEVLAERARAAGQELNGLTWESLADSWAGGGRGMSLDSSLITRGSAAWAHLTQAIAGLRKLDPDPQTARLDHDSTLVFQAGMQVLRSSGTDLRAGMAHAAREFRPQLERLNADAERAAAEERVSSDAASRAAGRAFIGSLGAGLLVLLLLAAHLQRLRRSAAVAEAERALERLSEARLRALVEHSSDVVSVLDRDLHVRWQSASVERMLGHQPSALHGRPIAELVHPEDAAALARHLETGARRPGTVRFSARFGHADGGWRHVETIAENRLDDEAVGGLVLNMRDVTDRKELEDELRHQAFHDRLTGLANRALFEDRLVHAVAGSRRHGQKVAVLFLDIDDFKTINDSLGHAYGDDLLKAVALRIAQALRPSDTAARLGGDEFAVLVELLDDADYAAGVATRILDALKPPFRISERELRVSASVGVAVGDPAVACPEELLRNADMAMYAAKENGKGTARFFQEGMHERVVDRLELREELQHAIAAEQFELDYQPIVELEGGRIVGAEALVRWRHPHRGRLAPVQFVALAEETGAIIPLGNWIVDAACRQAREWQLARPDRPAPSVAVNVSPRQLRDARFRDAVAATLAETGLEPASLVLEITESVLSEGPEVVGRQVAALKALGVRIAVDDFGTGYSALSRLQHFPIDILKIDRSFVDGIESDPAKARLVESIVGLGRTLQLDVVAEGIELAAQAEQLRRMRSPLGQGFLYSRPVAADEILAMLREGVPAL